MMKKTLSVLLCLAMLLSFMPASFAETEDEEIISIDFTQAAENTSDEEETLETEISAEPEDEEPFDEEEYEEEETAPAEEEDEIFDEAEDEIPAEADIEEEGEDEGEEEEFPFPLSAVHVNPVYENLFDAASLPLPEVPERVMGVNMFAEADYVSLSEATMQMASFVIARTPSFDLFVTVPKADDFWLDIYNAEVNAGNFTSGPKGGDSITYQYGVFNYSIVAYHSDKENFYAQINCAPLYYTGAMQEAQLDGAAAGIVSSLGLAGKSDYEKINAIYNYICTHVVYDYTNGAQNGDYTAYSAYGALCKGTAVCQGISLAIYRLCHEAGLSRVHMVTSNAMDHAWNIVDPGNGSYYYCDATWDLGSAQKDWHWFLRGTKCFSSEHTMAGVSYLGDCSPISYVKTDEGKLRYTRSYAPGIYNIDSGDYQIPVPDVHELSAPVITRVENAEKGISLSWNPVEGTAGYRLYFRENKEDWQLCCETTQCSHVLENVTAGKNYTFKLYCVDEYGRLASPASSPKGTVALVSPAIISCEDTVNSARIKWNASAGTSVYKLYFRLEGRSAWTLYTTSTGTEASVSGLTKGYTYEFAVTSCASGLESKIPAAGTKLKLTKTPQLPAPEITALSNYASYIKIAWNKVSGEDVRYRVFYRTGSEPWQIFRETVTTVLNFENPKAGTVYSFMIRCVDSKGNYISPYSTVKGIMRLESPRILAIRDDGRITQLSWLASPGASAYKVYYRTEGGRWTLLANVSRGFTVNVSLPQNVKKCEMWILSYASGQTSAFPDKGIVLNR